MSDIFDFGFTAVDEQELETVQKATTAAKEIADAAIQVMGGYGYVAEYVVERLWRDSKLLEIGGGTIESHQKNITRDLSKTPEVIND